MQADEDEGGEEGEEDEQQEDEDAQLQDEVCDTITIQLRCISYTRPIHYS